MNYKIIVQYDGTRYDGWQRQSHTERTIQGKLEQLLRRLTGQQVEVHGSGRTDAGVHAMGQTANFRLKEPICFYPDLNLSLALEDNNADDSAGKKKPRQEQAIAAKREEIPELLFTYMNQFLPADIGITQVREASERFHSRLNVVSKTYRYRIHTGAGKNVFDRNYVWHLGKELDIEAMRRAAEQLTGTHDFKSFCGNRHLKKSSTRTVSSISIQKDGPELLMEYTGNGFLYNMVRILTGTLVEVGMHERSPEEMTDILNACDRSAAGQTAPAAGLCLWKVTY